MRSFVEKIRALTGKSATNYDPEPLYTAIVAQARTPNLYRTDFMVPNTLDGRFDSLCLHLHLVLRRFGETEEFTQQTQSLLDRFFKDMDQTVREIGVGDMSVGKHVNKMAKAYYGRALAYEAVLHDHQMLSEKIMQNIFGVELKDQNTSEISDEAKNLASYAMAQAKNIQKQNTVDIIQGKITFLPAVIVATA
ncbi:MAG: ubiquinol-cytochrome C chaperone family protein [Alphaproteobacteria bacterium]